MHRETVGARPTSVSRRQVLAATAALAATNVVSEFAPAAPRAISIDGGRQLFVDDHLIADSSLERKWHLPEIQRGPILVPETALELNGGNRPVAAPFSDGLFYDPADGLFKLWYHAGWFDGIAYATSTDGIHWTRPRLDIEPGTNRVLAKRDGYSRDGSTTWLDLNSSDPEERYKHFVYFRRHGSPSVGEVYTSADGRHWRLRRLTGSLGDNSCFYYDSFRKVWVWSIRRTATSPRDHTGMVRVRVRREHSDFLESASWTDGDILGPAMEADSLDLPDPQLGYPTQLYHMTAVSYESIMLGSFLIHRGPPNEICERDRRPKITDITLGYSRDGMNWLRPDRRPFIASSRERGTWNFGYIHPAGGVCLIVADKLHFYFGAWSGVSPALGADMYAGGSTGLATLRRDGFASLEAGAGGASMTTTKILFSGKHLFVNANAEAGQLTVEVLDGSGVTLRGFAADRCIPIRADGTRQMVRWQSSSDLSRLIGKPVRIRFYLVRAQLYSFWVSPNVSGESLGYVAAGGPGLNRSQDSTTNAGSSASETS